MSPCSAGLGWADAFTAHPVWAVVAILALGWGVAGIIRAARGTK